MRSRLLPTLLLTVTLVTAACGAAPLSVDAATGAPSPAGASPDPTSGPTDAGEDVPTEDVPTDAPDDEAATEDVAAEATGSELAADAPDCSTQGMAAAVDLSHLPDAVRDTASFLLDAAVRCDEQLLATAADEDDTTLGYGTVTPHEAFSLPEGDDRFEAIVVLLTRLPHEARPEADGSTTAVWPRVHTRAWVDSDDAWQEVADAGLHPAELLDEMRDGGSGYLGWRLGIAKDGTWRFLVAGD